MSICKNVPEGGQHVTVRCAGCGSLHHTKNIGYTDPETHVVSIERSLFDITPCQCLDPHAHPLVHVCGIDCEDPEIVTEVSWITEKYEMLLESNLLRASANLGARIDKELWKDLQRYASDLARRLLLGTADKEEIERTLTLNAKYIEEK